MKAPNYLDITWFQKKLALAYYKAYTVTMKMAKFELKFQQRIVLFVGLVIFFLFFQIGIIEGSENPSSFSKPYEIYNIILVFIDTLRADHLNCYGYGRKTSPNIDKLAEESIVFKNNFTPITYTLPSFTSIITSLYPQSHGVLEIFKDRFPPQIKTLAEILKMYDYTTAWFGSLESSHLDPEVGFGRGFDVIAEFNNRDLKKAKKDLTGYIKEHQKDKFFLNFHTYKIHAPYFPSDKYREKFAKYKRKGIISSRDEYVTAATNEIRDALIRKEGTIWQILGEDCVSELVSGKIFQGDFDYRKLVDTSGNKKFKFFQVHDYVYFSKIDLKDMETKKYIEALYDGEILEFDSEIIAPLIKQLKRLNIYDKTIIIICADHGEEFGEHGGYGHGKTLYKEVTHVPFIIKVPWMKKGKQIQELIQTVDIMPTLLDLLGIPIPQQAQGKSLLDLISGNTNLPVYQYLFGHLQEISFIRAKKWKFILNHETGEKELYNLQLDPGEKHNLYSEKENFAAGLQSKLKKWEESLPCYKDKEYSFSLEIDKETQERIKKTGYW